MERLGLRHPKFKEEAKFAVDLERIISREYKLNYDPVHKYSILHERK